MLNYARWGRLCLIVLVLSLLADTPPVAAERRVALVVGNSDYKHVERLANPGNDAEDIAAALRRLGFEVDLQLDLTRVGLGRAVQQLADRARDADTAVFFYAGHGVQRDRISYLIPTDAELESEHDLPLFAVRLTELLAPLNNPDHATLVFLDACRNDPFAVTAEATRGLIASAGVGTPSAMGGMLIAYATGEGDTAADGRQRNSPFTRALLDHIETPGLEVKAMLTRVRRQLVERGGRQLTETSDRLTGDFYFRPTEDQVALANPSPPAPAVPHLSARGDFVLWEAIRTSGDPALFELFLEQYPDSPIAPAARLRLASLRQGAPEMPQPEPDPQPPPEAEMNVALLTAPEPQATSPRGVVSRLPPPDAATRYVVGSGVNLRAGRGVKSARVAFLNRGTPVSVGASANGWIEVWTATGQHGFVAERYLADPEAAQAAPKAEPVSPQRAKGPTPRSVGEVFRDCETCPELVALAPGLFRMGSPDDEAGRDHDEGPQRDVRLIRPLAVGRFEVTFAEWDACVADGGCGGYRPEDEGWGRDRRPVINVSFADAQAYVAWLAASTGRTYRLLSEAEWEYAARAGASGPNPWNDDDSRACRFANLHDETSWRDNAFAWTAARCSDGHARTAAVDGTANAFGLVNMLGNVAEWTADCWHGSVSDLPSDGLASTAGDCALRPLRGGDWRSSLDSVRYASRTPAPTGSRTAYDGFRIARDLDEGLRDGAATAKVAGVD